MDPATKPEFQNLPEPDVLAALDNKDSQNPIAIEVGRLVAAYTIGLRGRTAVPPHPPEVPPRSAIEAVALRLATRLAGLPVVKEAEKKPPAE